MGDEVEGCAQEDLRALGLKSTVRVEPAGTTKLFRFFVVSDAFKNLRHSERQNIVWRVVDRTLSPEDSIKVSMIMTLATTELGPDVPPLRPHVARKVQEHMVEDNLAKRRKRSKAAG